MELTRAEIIEKLEDMGVPYNKKHQTKLLAKQLSTLIDEEVKVVKATEKPAASEPEERKTIRCIIHSNDRMNEEHEIKGSVNGKMFQAQLGVEIDLPVELIPAIEDAAGEESVPNVDENGNIIPGQPKKVFRKRFIIERV